MPRARVFVCHPLPLDPAAVLGGVADVAVFGAERAPTRGELLAGAEGASALVTLLSEAVDAALLARLPQVRIVANIAVGYDNVDVSAATARGVWVTNTPGVLTEATADLTWALILALARRLREGERLVREGRFTGWSPTLLLGRELCGRTLGIFGFGRIGQAVARRAVGFGVRVIYCSRAPVSREIALGLGAQEVTKAELVAASDIVSIHCPLTAATRYAFGAPELAAMKPGSLLVNTARGPVVDEAALVAALARGHLGGAGLDVYEEEPRVHPGLLDRDDVVLLPHLGSATRETRTRMARMALEDVARVLRGERPLHAVNDVTSSPPP